MLEFLMRSGAGVRVLGVALFSEGRYLREIARQASVSPSEASRELAILARAGVLRSEKRGNQLLFFTNASCPFLSELKSLYRKTEGAVPAIRQLLSSLPGVKYSAVFGSVASGKEKPASDIDLLVIGSMDDDALSRGIFEIQTQTGREINFVVWSEKDLLDKARRKSSFLRNIVKNRRIWLTGDERGFARIAKEGGIAPGRA
jgi:predicted nucleotidyltransferase